MSIARDIDPGRGARRIGVMRARAGPGTERAATRAIERRDFRAAVTVLARGISRRGEDVVSLTMMAQCHEWLGEDARAVDCACRVLADSPAEPMNLRLVARCCVRLGDPGRAYRCICRALAERRRGPLPRPGWLRALLRRLPMGRMPMMWGRARAGPAAEPEWIAWALDWKASYEAARRGERGVTLH